MSNFCSLFECHLKTAVVSSDQGFSVPWCSLSKAGDPRGAGCTLFLQSTEEKVEVSPMVNMKADDKPGEVLKFRAAWAA